MIFPLISIVGIILILGVREMNSYKNYGLIQGLEVISIKGIVEYASKVLAWGANSEDLKNFLYEIAIAESNLGRAVDNTPNSGMGIWQFDRNAFEDVKKWIATRKSSEFTQFTLKDINNIEYKELARSPFVAVFFARAYLYSRIPEKIGKSIQERAYQWKKYYNTYLGAGSEQGYIHKVSKTKEALT